MNSAVIPSERSRVPACGRMRDLAHARGDRIPRLRRFAPPLGMTAWVRRFAPPLGMTAWVRRFAPPLGMTAWVRRFAPPLGMTLVLCGCLHRAPSLPAPIPHLDAKPREAFALRYIDATVGTGREVAPKKCIYAHYTGWLTNGKKFDSSRDSANGKPRNPISFPQSFRRVIAGWDLGFEGMRVGGRRRLFIPYQLAYGEAGRPPIIPPKAELVFDVELVAVADTVAAPRTAGASAPQCPSQP